jgi:hypothetical protein
MLGSLSVSAIDIRQRACLLAACSGLFTQLSALSVPTLSVVAPGTFLLKQHFSSNLRFCPHCINIPCPGLLA